MKKNIGYIALSLFLLLLGLSLLRVSPLPLYSCARIPPRLPEKFLPQRTVKVRILAEVDSLAVSCRKKCYLTDLKNAKKTVLAAKSVSVVRANGGNLLLNDISTQSDRIMFSTDINDIGDDFIYLDNRPYRGNLIIKAAAKNRFSVINEVGIDAYIYGILPYEIDPDWPIEAVKAQSVVARTFAMTNLKARHANLDFNFCNTDHCQVYGGASGEKDHANRAVDQTTGEVVTFNGNLANTVYHSCCGGYTESAGNVWPSDPPSPPYLSARPCSFCKQSPYYRWKTVLKEEFIVKKLLGACPDMRRISSISLSGKTKSGRIEFVNIKYQNKDGKTASKKMSSAQFRLAVSTWEVKSTKIVSVNKYGDSFEFLGKGWGHGVGMCQWGSKGMAEMSFTYDQILKHYYPGTELETWRK